ncbi:carbohydrate ABC transporter permease [Paenibacillus sp. PAMC21692]|uniref:carbohydrate ABC transporter permease n=1 Tax=Paenibacillus sp. PAMC21692 TaxID=2762320 RepID=UPI00164E4126|nr:carbohydrate ABC transporter permease [Paenibacillus sp. PAMC21692]QNK57955.1 carbohydrate ABC transporter permease [Paenibacillus sp. PAMC21692]
MKERKQMRKITSILTRIPLVLYSVVVLYPLVWTVFSSFKTTTEFYASPFSFPTVFDFTNYVKAFTEASIGSYMWNSVAVSVFAILLCNGFAFTAAYVLVRYTFPFSGLLKRIFMSAMFIPIAFSIIPLFMMLNQIHLLDNRFGLVLVYAASAIPFTVYLMTGFLASISREYEEAARMDGCNNFGVLFRIIAPMARSGLITVTIFNFMTFWNEYIMALSFISSESKRTLTLGIAFLMEVQRYATDWGALFAGLVIVMIPTLVLYALLQRKITSGLNMGGLKG